MTNQATYIIDKFGGIRPLAREGSYPPSTVQRWAESGWIPAKHQKPLLELGAKLGVDISPADFFDYPGNT